MTTFITNSEVASQRNVEVAKRAMNFSPIFLPSLICIPLWFICKPNEEKECQLSPALFFPAFTIYDLSSHRSHRSTNCPMRRRERKRLEHNETYPTPPQLSVVISYFIWAILGDLLVEGWITEALRKYVNKYGLVILLCKIKLGRKDNCLVSHTFCHSLLKIWMLNFYIFL